MVSLSVVSEIAIVPDSECRMPTLIVSSWAFAGTDTKMPAARAIAEMSFANAASFPVMSVFSKPFVAPQKNQATAMPVRQPIDGCGQIAANSAPYRRRSVIGLVGSACWPAAPRRFVAASD